MEDCKPVKTPMEIKPLILKENEIYDDSRPYRELIGCLMYVMITTRPDLSASVNYFSRHQTHQTEQLWKRFKRILRYIKGSLDLGLWFKKVEKESLLCYADADFGSEYDRKSISGFTMKVFGIQFIGLPKDKLQLHYRQLTMNILLLQWLYQICYG
ncbi:hypothetical protein ILUMI_17769 [Ignelater luminosus]|uniref:Uncharacterized protein n=1 Tax=Ignelater luminosus TaxID=2038154 RepID=A0A8K0G704_IGNLU|nr:hypothetical protein ILUMI_17769 [Ignelater luminosus]